MENKKVGVGFGVLLIKNNKILLGKRHIDPEKADTEFQAVGTWTMPGGKLEYGESLEEGAIREVLEETGIKLNHTKVICVNNDKNEHAHFVTIGLTSENFKGEPQVLEPDEITEWAWFDIENLPSPMYFPSKKLLINYLEKTFYKEHKNI